MIRFFLLAAFVVKALPAQNLNYGLPTLSINTEGGAPVVSKEIYLDARIQIQSEDGSFSFESPLKIKGRGNTTWDMPKKPYRLKFAKGESPLGMPAETDWVLLANYSDKTLLRNRLAFELSRRLELDYSPRSHYVEFYLNNSYRGNYLLTEQIQVSPARVDIAKLRPTDLSPDLISGGYLLEIDHRLGADHCFHSPVMQLPFCIKAPDTVVGAQIEYIQDYIGELEMALYAPNFADPVEGYAKYLDVDTFVNWYLVNEILKNQDAKIWASIYLHKDRNGKLKMGPVWDFDIGAGNVNYSDAQYPERWWIRLENWYARLFQDPSFEAKVRQRWQELKVTQFDTLGDYIEQNAQYLNLSQTHNFERWPILSTPVWPNPVVTGSYNGEIEYLKNWLNTRFAWLAANF